MKKEDKNIDLLSEIGAMVGLDCLSDLHFMEDMTPISLAVANIPPDKYSSKEWCEAIGYIESTTKQPDRKQFSSAEDAKKYLLNIKRRLARTN